jgi:membrane associated rhomboid family serine protease
MPRYPSRYVSQSSSFSIGPGPISTALKTIIAANVAMFLITTFVPQLRITLGLVPAWVLRDGRVWTLVTYMFVHADTLHILFNMLILWFIGAELERLWG